MRVNKGRAKPEYRIQRGDQVRIPPLRMATSADPGVAVKDAGRLLGAVLY